MTTNVNISSNYIMSGKRLRIAVVHPISGELWREIFATVPQDLAGIADTGNLCVHDGAKIVIEEVDEVSIAEPAPVETVAEPVVVEAPAEESSSSPPDEVAAADMVVEGSPVDSFAGESVQLTDEQKAAADQAGRAAAEFLRTETVEQEIQRKGLTAPRITPQDIDNAIVAAQFWQPTGTTLTVCALTLQNGTTITGESACASPENFDAEVGQRLAHADARRKIWALEGYLLRERLSHGLAQAA